jgi:hypothetical protein
VGLEAEVYNSLTTSVTLTGMVGSNIYPIYAPQGTGHPAVVYRRSAGERIHDFDGYSTIENAQFEVVVFATAVTARRRVSDAVIGALSSATAFRGLAISSPQDRYDDSVRLYARIYDISIWYTG